MIVGRVAGSGRIGVAGRLLQTTSIQRLLGSSLRLWLNGSGVTLSGSNITTLLDQSGNGFNFAAGGVTPTLTALAINGQPGATLTSTATMTCGSNANVIIPGASAERLMVFYAPTANSVTDAFYGTSGASDAIPFSDGNVYDGFATSARKIFPKAGTYNAVGVGCIYDSYSIANDFSAFLNGVLIFATGTNTFGVSTSAPMFNTGGSYTLCEFLVISPKMSPPTRTQLHRIIGSNYAIAVP